MASKFMVGVVDCGELEAYDATRITPVSFDDFMESGAASNYFTTNDEGYAELNESILDENGGGVFRVKGDYVEF